MKYILTDKTTHNPDERSWYYDDFGNRIDKETGDFVVLVSKVREDYKQPPMALVNVQGEWLPKQMEFDFG